MCFLRHDYVNMYVMVGKKGDMISMFFLNFFFKIVLYVK